MLVSWYLPTPAFSLWPCAVLLVVFVPIAIWHEHNWRKTLEAYAHVRRSAGAVDPEWPSKELRSALGVQPWLVLVVSAVLGVFTIFSAWAGAIWPRTPLGFDIPVNPLDLPFLWSMVVAATAATIAGVAIGVDLMRSPWAGVAYQVRRAIYAPAAEMRRRFALALAVDPGVPQGEATAAAPPAPAAVAAPTGGADVAAESGPPAGGSSAS